MERDSAVCFEPRKVKPLDAVRTDSIDLSAVFRQALDGVPHAHKVLAAIAGYAPDYWTRILTGERGVLLGRLGQLPVDAQRAMVLAWAEALGMRLDRRSDAAQRALDALATAALALAEI